VCTETPPTRRPFSTTRTDRPSLAAWIAARRPAGPLPMTMKSIVLTGDKTGGNRAAVSIVIVVSWNQPETTIEVTFTTPKSTVALIDNRLTMNKSLSDRLIPPRA
jgi:hypothetical protein